MARIAELLMRELMPDVIVGFGKPVLATPSLILEETTRVETTRSSSTIGPNEGDVLLSTELSYESGSSSEELCCRSCRSKLDAVDEIFNGIDDGCCGCFHRTR